MCTCYCSFTSQPTIRKTLSSAVATLSPTKVCTRIHSCTVYTMCMVYLIWLQFFSLSFSLFPRPTQVHPVSCHLYLDPLHGLDLHHLYLNHLTMRKKSVNVCISSSFSSPLPYSSSNVHIVHYDNASPPPLLSL